MNSVRGCRVSCDHSSTGPAVDPDPSAPGCLFLRFPSQCDHKRPFDHSNVYDPQKRPLRTTEGDQNTQNFDVREPRFFEPCDFRGATSRSLRRMSSRSNTIVHLTELLSQTDSFSQPLSQGFFQSSNSLEERDSQIPAADSSWSWSAPPRREEPTTSSVLPNLGGVPRRTRSPGENPGLRSHGAQSQLRVGPSSALGSPEVRAHVVGDRAQSVLRDAEQRKINEEVRNGVVQLSEQLDQLVGTVERVSSSLQSIASQIGDLRGDTSRSSNDTALRLRHVEQQIQRLESQVCERAAPPAETGGSISRKRPSSQLTERRADLRRGEQNKRSKGSRLVLSEDEEGSRPEEDWLFEC
jgi:hypothetical protein